MARNLGRPAAAGVAFTFLLLWWLPEDSQPSQSPNLGSVIQRATSPSFLGVDDADDDSDRRPLDENDEPPEEPLPKTVRRPARPAERSGLQDRNTDPDPESEPAPRPTPRPAAPPPRLGRPPQKSLKGKMSAQDYLDELEGEKEFTFLSLGDSGYEVPQVLEVAATMKKWADKVRAPFFIHTGDAFYPKGVSSISDPQFQSKFEKPFGDESFRRRWFMCVGNHDYIKGGNVAAQVEYTAKSERWYLPKPHYTAKVKANGFDLEFFVFDQYEPTEYGSISSANPYPKQLGWLEKELRRSTADWKIVICHRPFFSSGHWHGTYPLWQKAINPMMIKYGVQVYFAGDDHILEYLVEKRTGITHIVNGAGSQPHSFKRIDPRSLFHWSGFGFATHHVNATHFTTQFISKDDKLLYTHSANIVLSKNMP